MTKALGQAENSGGLRPIKYYRWRKEENEAGFWLVELAGTLDRHGIPHVWRDLNRRFPDAMRERSLLPRQQGVIEFNERERSAWYRLYVARFDLEREARDFCDGLLQQLQRCRVVASSDSEFVTDSDGRLDDSEKLSDPTAEQRVPVVSKPDEVPVDSVSNLVYGVTLTPVASGKLVEPLVVKPGGAIPRRQAPLGEFEPSLLRPAGELGSTPATKQ
jgi:hypothetical protein